MNQKNYFYSVGKQEQDPSRVVEIKIRRSIFICSLTYASDIENAKGFISRISKLHSSATHNCWAYIIGHAGEIYHSSDAGEPAGTAGKPILNTLNKYSMTYTAAVVTRYFGGVKLGIRGLIDAYSQSVKTAIEESGLVRLVSTSLFEVSLPYDFNDLFLQQARAFSPQINHTEYMESVTHNIEIEQSLAEDFVEMLNEYKTRGRIDYREL